MEKPLNEWTGKELQAEIDLYTAAGVEDIPKFKNKGEAIAWIEAARAEGGIGVPHILTKEDVEKLPEEDEAKVGDVIILGPIAKKPDDVNDDGSPKTEDEEAEDTQPLPPETPKSKSEERRENVQRSEAVKAPQLFLGRMPVIAVENRLIGGQLYKDVVLNGETRRLSEQEFAEQVKPLEE